VGCDKRILNYTLLPVVPVLPLEMELVSALVREMGPVPVLVLEPALELELELHS